MFPALVQTLENSAWYAGHLRITVGLYQQSV
jgi:hypothetical protein